MIRERIIKSKVLIKNSDIISRLNSSYVCFKGFQGPVKLIKLAIVELLKNKRIAVTANSHKVIHNLLHSKEIAMKKTHIQGTKDGQS